MPICGRLSLPDGSVCSACSVGHSPHLLCWCCRSSCTSVVVFSHGFHGFPQMVRLRYWRRGYGRMPYPPNLCASVPICGRYFSARMFCVFRVFCGNSLPVCLVMSVVVFSHGIHGIHGMLGCVIGGVGMAGMPYPPNLCTSVQSVGGTSLPECSVCSAYSVGHSLPVCLVGAVLLVQLGWCT